MNCTHASVILFYFNSISSALAVPVAVSKNADHKFKKRLDNKSESK